MDIAYWQMLFRPKWVFCRRATRHFAKFDMLVAALVNRCIECGLHLILNKQGRRGKNTSAEQKDAIICSVWD